MDHSRREAGRLFAFCPSIIRELDDYDYTLHSRSGVR